MFSYSDGEDYWDDLIPIGIALLPWLGLGVIIILT